MSLAAWIGLTIGLFAVPSLQAQHLSDTSILINPVTITASSLDRIPVPPVFSGSGSALPLQVARTAADYLQEEAGMVILQYSQGGLSTTSYQGLPARYTPVYWNGLNLHSAMNGVSDLALIPAFLVDSINVYSGPANSTQMTGSLAGNIQVHSLLPLQKGWHGALHLGLGSFGQQGLAGRLSYSGQRFQFGVRAYQQRAQNDFPFRDIKQAGSVYLRMPNNEMFQRGLTTDLGGTLGLAKWSLHAWLHDASKQLPPTLSETSSKARQSDRQFRSVARLRQPLGERFSLEVQTALLQEEINYQNPDPDISTWRSSQSAAALQYRTEVLQWTLGTSYQYHSGETQFYGHLRERNTLGFSVQVESLRETYLRYGASLKADRTDAKWFRPNAELHLGNALSSGFHWNVSAQYTFQLPSLNDLYWAGLGNPELAPESGYHLSGSVNWRLAQGFSLEGLLFSRWVEDWIQWLPEESTGLFRPSNIKSVWSRGLELGLAYERNVGMLKFKSGLRYCYNPVTNRQIYADAVATSAGKQLIYMPRHKMHGKVGLQYKNAELGIYGQWISERNARADADRSGRMPSFLLMQLKGGYRFSFGGWRLELYAKLGNLLDTEYQWIQYRAMPLRHFSLDLAIRF